MNVTSENKRSRICSTRVTWADVVRALADDETRSCALSRFRDSGFSADSFGHRTEARRSLMEGLVRAEDWLEAEHPRRERERAALRDVRRRLEWELDP